MKKSKNSNRQSITESKLDNNDNNIEVTDLETIDLGTMNLEEAGTTDTATDQTSSSAHGIEREGTTADFDQEEDAGTDREEAKADMEESTAADTDQDEAYTNMGENNNASLEFLDLEEDIPGNADANRSPKEEAESEESSPARSFFSKINWHIVFLLLVLLIIGLVIYRFKTFGKHIDLSQIEGVDENDVLDSIMPLIVPKDKEVNIVDDGVTTILAFGNAPFADDRESPDNLVNMIGKKTGAKVYNCSVEGSYLAAIKETLRPEEMAIDAFNFYWLTALMCFNDQDNVLHNYELAFDFYGEDAPEGAREAYDTLTTIDMNTVDVITIMYDASDYMKGLPMYDDANATNIQTYTGNMEAGIELIQSYYPHIRIIVMSAPYAFAIDEEGKYVESDLYRYGEQDVLSTYVIKQFGSAYTRSVTFLDNLYGSITADNAKEYLTDNIHVNVKGRELLAERFKYALEYYDK